MTQELQQLPAYDEQAEAEHSQQEAAELLSAAVVNISNSSQLPHLRIGGAENGWGSHGSHGEAVGRDSQNTAQI